MKQTLKKMKPKGKPRRMTKKTPQESKVRKRPGMAYGGKARMKYSKGGEAMPKAKPC